MNCGKLYLPGFHGLRFISALLIFFTSFEIFLFNQGVKNDQATAFTLELGSLAISFVFVLCGFWVTHELKKEKIESGDVQARKFIIRRSLSLLPVFFVFILLGPFVFSFIEDVVKPDFIPGANQIGPDTLFFLELDETSRRSLLYISHLWPVVSVFIFYLIILLIVKFHWKPMLPLIALTILCVWLREKGIKYDSEILFGSFYFFRFDCFAMGALCGLGWYKHRLLMKTVFSNFFTRLIIFTAVVLTFISTWEKPLYHHTAQAFIFGCFLLVLCTVQEKRVLPSGRVWEFLGDISYAFFAFHLLAIHGAIYLFGSGRVSIIPAFIFCLVGSLGIFLLYQKPFVRLKLKYSVNASGEIK